MQGLKNTTRSRTRRKLVWMSTSNLRNCFTRSISAHHQTHKERQRSQWKIKQKSTMMTRKKETIMRRRTKKRSRKGCHMNVCTCQFAALGGHLEMLRQRLSLGCIIIAFNLNTSLLKSVHHLVSTLSLFFFFSLLLQSSSSKTHFSPACTRKNSGSWSTRERKRERERERERERRGAQRHKQRNRKGKRKEGKGEQL